MPKHIIEFDLPEEKEDLKVTMNAWRYKTVVDDFMSYLRGKLKYENLPAKEASVLEYVREEFVRLVNEEEI